MVYVIDKKQMHGSVITGKEYASKGWTCAISMFLTSLMSLLCVVVHVLCVYASKLLSDFFWLFWHKFWLCLMKTGWQACCVV